MMEHVAPLSGSYSTNITTCYTTHTTAVYMHDIQTKLLNLDEAVRFIIAVVNVIYAPATSHGLLT